MNQLVFVQSQSMKETPFTTSDAIAEYAGIKHHAIQQMIAKHETSLKSFGLVAFEMRACPHRTGASVEKIYHLNEQQATLLITFLKNTEKVIRFKTELVRQFYQMRAQLQERQIAKADRKVPHRSLTDAIQSNPNHGKWDYKMYMDLVYKTVLGKTAAQIRKERGAEKKTPASDYMAAEETQAIARLEDQVAALIELGMDYQQIKALLLNRQAMKNIA